MRKPNRLQSAAATNEKFPTGTLRVGDGRSGVLAAPTIPDERGRRAVAGRGCRGTGGWFILETIL